MPDNKKELGIFNYKVPNLGYVYWYIKVLCKVVVIKLLILVRCFRCVDKSSLFIS
jgi:hypothetical protein